MFSRPDSRRIAAIARLVRTPDGAELLATIEEELSALTEALVHADANKFQVLQGQVRQTQSFLELLNKAPDLADKQQKR